MTRKPNLVFIMTDQQRVDTIAAWGFPHMTTPALDRLARNGVSWRRAYAPAATCVSSRAAIFTGMHPHNTGVYSFHDWAHQRNWVQMLQEAGWHTASIGKMHFKPEFVSGGFDERIVVENPTHAPVVYGGEEDDWGRHLKAHGAERPLDRHTKDKAWEGRKQGVAWHLDEKLHSDVYIGDEAVKWIENRKGDEPFFLQVGFVGPHEPYDPLPRDLALYEKRDVPMPVHRDGELDSKPPQIRAHAEFFASVDSESRLDLRSATDDEMRAMRRHYYAKITTVDRKIGEVLDALERKGFLEDALVIFTSDHGDMLCDHRLPYKWLMYENSVHVPLIVWDTRAGSRGSTEDRLVSLLDIGPTFLARAGLVPESHLEGTALVEGAKDDPGEMVFCEDNYLLMARSRTHKLVLYHGQEAGELYDLEKDPGELDNLFDRKEHREVRSDLERRTLAWLGRSLYRNAGYKAGMPRHYKLREPSGGAALHG